MLPLGLILVDLFFLIVGAGVFLLFMALPAGQKVALSAALWCAVWGPCLTICMLFAGFVAFAQQLTTDDIGSKKSIQQIPAGLWHGYGYLVIAGTVLVATTVAWFHQVLIHRMTFWLFRLYATAVTGAIGIVVGMAFSFLLLDYNLPFAYAAAAWLLPAPIFAYGGYRWARRMRGAAPVRYTWITPAEFEGLSG